MVLRVFAIGCPHKAADRQVEAERAILPLVVPVRDERRDAVGNLIVTQHMLDDAVDRSVPAASLFVGHAACIAETGKYEAVDDASDLVLVAGEPGQGADRTGDE